MIRKVLVATDLSAGADRAMERAQHLAIERGAELLCISAIEPVGGRQSFDLSERQELIRRHFEATALGCHCTSQVAVAVGDAGTVLAGFEEMLGPDIIVIGDGGHTEGRGLRAIIGATRGAVLIVRSRAFAPYGKAVMPHSSKIDLVDALVRLSAGGGVLRVTDRKHWMAESGGGEDLLIAPL